MSRPSLERLIGAVDSLGPVIQARIETSVSSSVDQGFETARAATVARAESEAEAIAQKTAATIEKAVSAASSARQAVETEVSGIHSRVAEMRRRTESELEGFTRQIRDRKSETTDLFADLQQIIDKSAGLLSEQVAGSLQEGVDALESGASTYQEFIRTYGDLGIILEDRRGKLREIVAQTNTDTSAFARQFRDLFDFVRDDAVSFDEALGALEERLQGRFKGIAELFESFREKGLTIEQLRKQLEEFTGALGDGPLEDVVNELLQKLREESRR